MASAAASTNETKLPSSEQHQHKSELSQQQFRLWYIQQLNTNFAGFHSSSLIRFTRPVDPDKLQAAINKFRKKHPLTRARIEQEQHHPCLVIEKYSPARSAVCTDYPSYRDLHSHVSKIAATAFDAEQNKLFDYCIYQLENGEYFLFTSAHQTIWDEQCHSLFYEDLASFFQGDEIVHPSDAPTYFDYIADQQLLLKTEQLTQQKAFWLEMLKGDLPVLDLPLDYPRPAVLTFKAESCFLHWTEDEIKPLIQLAQQQQTPLSVLFLLGFYILLFRYSQQRDIIVGLPAKGRDNPLVKQLIGLFESNIAIRFTLDPDKNISRTLEDLNKLIQQGYEHAEVPFEDILRELATERNSAHPPVYQSFFSFQDTTEPTNPVAVLPMERIALPRGGCQTELDLRLHRDRNGVMGQFDFMVELFSPESMALLADNYKQILQSMAAADPLTTVGFLDFLSPANRETLLNRLNQTEMPLPPVLAVHSLIEQTVDQNRDIVCALDLEDSLTYGELDDQANQLAHYLVEQGTQPDDLIGISVNRTVSLLVAILATWKAGAGYVPLDPDFPDQRLEYMVNHSKLSLMITNQEHEERNAFSTVKKIYIDQPDPWQSMPVDRVSVKLSLEHTCHVIYTSGSTGQPKGVQICQQSMINFLCAMEKKPGIDASDIICSLTTLSFDISVLELYLPLICGGKVLIVTREISMYGDLLSKVLTEKNVTYMQATPASWRLLLHAGWQPPPGFKILCGGEPFPKDLAMSLLEHCPEVWNMYGPTETTVWSTAHKVRADEKIIRIGRPVDNTSIYILDQDRQLVAQGVTGKLYIGGKGLALGYLHRPDLTAERFVANPYKKGELIYDTGDLARYHANGELECLGRDDGQVKVRGYRIELGEIESVLASFPGVQQQVVIVREDQPGDAKLAAYYIADRELDITSLRNHLLGILPIYMIPADFVWMERFPMTLNEKIDRKNLPVPKPVALEHPQAVTASEQQMNPTELHLYQMWSELFNRNDFGITDNFFDLGGYSLLSVEMFGLVEKEYGLNLPLSTLFEYGSIQTLGALIDQKCSLNKITTKSQVLHKNQLHALTLMRPGTTGEPVFFFHGVGGNILNYHILFSAIPPERPVYGLQSSGIDGQSQLAADFSEMVSHYCSEIKILFPNHKYLFIGGSMGGLVALEAARNMRKNGGEIDKIIMFDTQGPCIDPIRYPEKKDKFFARVCGFMSDHWTCLNMNLRASCCRLLLRSLSHDIRYHFVRTNNHKLIREHRLQPINEDVILIRSLQDESGPNADPLLGWEGIIQGELKIFTTEADHDTIIEDEKAREILKDLISE